MVLTILSPNPVYAILPLCNGSEDLISECGQLMVNEDRCARKGIICLPNERKLYGYNN